ncbi:DUF4391 domain-containing protein [Indiicoccus explosivorum]|uniref:DUF4391 domain-containing protein n=1 Tax=Indiicoccus explosivorum TaxID=1917864 RepID=UPI001F4E1375|nr:DUF4391 domain-containing protein [Indiicoccus explosivorum]
MLLEKLGYPKKSIVNRILAKDRIVQSGELTQSEKDYLTSEIDRVYILAVLNESSTNVATYRSEQYRYEEILCLYVQLREKQKVDQLKKLFHRIFPNPVFLIFASFEGELMMSTCTKRLNLQNDLKVISDKVVSTGWFTFAADSEYSKLLNSLNFVKQPLANLHELYKHMDSKLRVSKAIDVVGTYPTSGTNQEEVLQLIERIEKLNVSIETLEKEQKKAIEFNEKMEWHMKIKQNEQEAEKEIERLRGII